MTGDLHERGLADVDIRQFRTVLGCRDYVQELSSHGCLPFPTPFVVLVGSTRQAGGRTGVDWLVEVVARWSQGLATSAAVWAHELSGDASRFSFASLSSLAKRAKGRIVRTEIGDKIARVSCWSTEVLRSVASQGTERRRPVGRSTVTWVLLR